MDNVSFQHVLLKTIASTNDAVEPSIGQPCSSRKNIIVIYLIYEVNRYLISRNSYYKLWVSAEQKAKRPQQNPLDLNNQDTRTQEWEDPI